MSAASPPSATPRRPARSGPGCLVSLILFVVVVVAGIVIGTMLNDEDEPASEVAVTVSEGTLGDSAWRVDAVRDVEGEVCAFFFQDGEQLTGSCDTTPQDATIDGTTVVFGKAPPSRTSLRVNLDSGASIQADADSVEGFDDRFYVAQVDADVDAVSLAFDTG